MSTAKTNDPQALDALTGGAFSAPTSGERAARVRDWLATQPSADQMQEVFRELSGRDKGAARLLRERLDELKRAKGQEAIGAEWAEKAQALLQHPRLNIADAMAWQRDAAKAGAPLSREPLAGFKAQLADRVRGIEDLQHRVQVQREAAVLLAQRIEVLSTKSWRDAQAAVEALRADVPQWHAQAQSLLDDPNWASVDPKFPPLLEASRGQLQVVWDAFQSALGLALAAADDASAPLPPVPVWADELRQARGVAVEPAARPARPKADPEVRAKAQAVVGDALAKLEQEISQGHGKATPGAANALRSALKDHGRLVDGKLEAQAHAALAAATELEGWQRWRADQLRQELVAKAEALFEQPAPRKPKPHRAAVAAAAGSEGEVQAASTAAGVDASAGPTPDLAAEPAAAAPGGETSAAAQGETPAVASTPGEAGGDETVDRPVATDAGPAAALDAAPDAGSAATLDAAPDAADSAPAPHAGAKPAGPRARVTDDMPGVAPGPRKPRYGGRKMQETLRALRDQWKQVDQGGAPNHALWKRFDEACNEAYKVVQEWLDKVKAEAAEHRSARLALIEEVKAWAAEHPQPERGDWKSFHRALHQFGDRWREAGHLSERAFAELQPLWKAAIDLAAGPLEQAQQASIDRRQAMIEEARLLGEAPMLRIDAVKALQQRWQAEAQTVPLDRKFEQRLWDTFRKPIDDAFQRKTADREKASAAMSDRDRAVLDASRALEAAAGTGDAQKIRVAMNALDAATRGRDDAAAAGKATAPAAPTPQPAAPADAAPADAAPADAPAADGALSDAVEGEAAAPAPAPAPAKPPPKPVVAMRGDDRPGGRRAETATNVRGGKFEPRRGGPGGPGGPGGRDSRDGRAGRFEREEREDRGPRLGDAAFRAQRDALERAEGALRKLASQAHGEALTQLLAAWEHRAADRAPSQQELGRAVPPAVRAKWLQALGQGGSGDAASALLRLEIAAEVPTPAEQMTARRAMQLQLLTRRHDPSPQETWGADVAQVLATGFDEASARRLQNVLKVLLRK